MKNKNLKYAILLWKEEHPGCDVQIIHGNAYGFIYGYNRDYVFIKNDRAIPIYVESPVSLNYLKRLHINHFGK